MNGKFFVKNGSKQQMRWQVYCTIILQLFNPLSVFN
jgi:hypothetical protein